MNTKILKLMLTLIVMSLLTVACVTKRVVTKAAPMPKKTIMAIGYGAAGSNQLSAAQRRLMGMRASKVEAYRSLVEQIYGVHINSHATVENMAARFDQVRATVDAIVRGARVKRITAIDADTYETVLEVELTAQFFECFSASGRDLDRCLSANSDMSLSGASAEHPRMIPVIMRRAACNSDDCYNYPDVHGFALAFSGTHDADDMLQATSRPRERQGQLYNGMMTTGGFR